MVVVVLGIDGLEFSLVEKFNLKSLKQKRYAKLVLDDFDIIVSPLIWASMITGVVFMEMVERFTRAPSLTPLFHSSRGFWANVKGLLPWRIRRVLGRQLSYLQNVIEKNPMESTSQYLKKHKIPTIFDECNSWHNAIPGYDKANLAGMLTSEAFDNKKAKRALLKSREALFRKQTRELFQAFSHKADYELIFWYTNWIDFTGHLEYGNKLKTMNRYLEINLLARRVQEKLSSNDLLYIVSDHGMIPSGRFGYHSDHGFFSSSTGETIRKPQELYSLMKKNIGLMRLHSK